MLHPQHSMGFREKKISAWRKTNRASKYDMLYSWRNEKKEREREEKLPIPKLSSWQREEKGVSSFKPEEEKDDSLVGGCVHGTIDSAVSSWESWQLTKLSLARSVRLSVCRCVGLRKLNSQSRFRFKYPKLVIRYIRELFLHCVYKTALSDFLDSKLIRTFCGWENENRSIQTFLSAYERTYVSQKSGWSNCRSRKLLNVSRSNIFSYCLTSY